MQKDKKQVVATKIETIPTDKAETTALTIVKQGEEPKAEETTAVIMDDAKKPTMNLAQTLKLVESLHLKKRQRDNLEASIESLEAFDIEQKEENLDDRNYYSGCLITLKDDNRHEWSTKNPVIIGDLIKFLTGKFSQKLTEIEAEIVLP